MYIEIEKLYKKYPKLLKNDVTKIQEWLKRQPHLPHLTDLEVVIFLKAANYRIEATKLRIDGK